MLIIRKKKNCKLSFHVIIQILQSNFHLTIDYPPITTRAYPYFSAHPIRLSPRKFDFHSRSQLLKWTKVISPSRFDKNLCLCKEKMRSGRRGWRKKPGKSERWCNFCIHCSHRLQTFCIDTAVLTHALLDGIRAQLPRSTRRIKLSRMRPGCLLRI